MRDIVIIGNGSAGLAAAIYAKRAGLDAVTVSDAPNGGGQIATTYEVDNYPGLPGVGGMELGDKMAEHAEKLGCESMLGRVTEIRDISDEANASGNSKDTEPEKKNIPHENGITTGESAEVENSGMAGKRTDALRGKIVVTDKGEIETRAVILATGAEHSKLGVPGEEEHIGMGVSYCATCDGAFFRKRTVAVVGGGDVALGDAIFLSRFAEKVYLIHRRDEFRGAKILQEKALATENIEAIYDTVVEEVVGADVVEKLLIKNVKTGEQSELPVGGVFMAVGTHANLDGIQGLPERNAAGYIVAGEDCETSIPGIYAAGDVRTKQLRQVVTAVADGANAVTSIERYLS